MMKGNKFFIITTIILGILVIAMGVYIIYDNFMKDENIVQSNNNENINNNEQSLKYTYDDIKGVYTYIDDIDENASFILSLFGNGTFKYSEGPAGGAYGNYIIKDSKVVLNELFNFGTDIKIFPITGLRTLTIVDKDTLLDTDESIEKLYNIPSVTLKKDTSESTSIDFQRNDDFSYCLKTDCLLINDALNDYCYID